ncbi:MAG: PHP domain-containing protein, partial [Acidimicrobiales bacterium]
ECHYARYSPFEREALADLARRLGLVATGGSDFHGSYKPGISVGFGTGDLRVEDGVLDELRDRLGR